MNKLFTGIHSAIFSIYDENLNVKADTVGKLVEYQLRGGVNGFYVGGNTGECTVLPARTRMGMLDAVVEANNGRGKIMAHIGAGHFDEVMTLLEHANSKKIDAIASLPPSLQSFYSREETIEYYKYIARESKYPVYAYVTPVTMQHSDLFGFASELSKISNIAGLKVTVPDYAGFAAINKLDGGRLNNLSGPDDKIVCALAIGADGAIGTTYNLLPKVAVKIYNSFLAHDTERALEYQNKLNSVINVLIDGNDAYWKAVLSLLGFDMGYTVFPAKPVSEKELSELKMKLDSVGFFDMV